MSINDPRFAQYYSEPHNDEYKGFKLKGSIKRDKATGKWHLTFTNGDKEITVIGISKDDAYVKGFDAIDKYLNK